MPLLVDANVLVRLRDSNSPHHASCSQWFRSVPQQVGQFVLCAQTLIEYWVVATRPRDVNGLGLTPGEADLDLNDFLLALDLLPEPADVLLQWRRHVVAHSVSGKSAHDARLVAVMDAYGIRQILTLNAADFSRYPIECMTPQQLLRQT